MRKLCALAIVALLALPVAAAASDAIPWNVDAAHSEVNFKVRHFFTPVTGSFGDHEIKLMFDESNLENSSVEARIAVASVNTGNEGRDEHLRSADWFEAADHGYITFTSTAIRKTGMNEYVAVGDLTIKGTTKQIEMPLQLLGVKEIPEMMRGMLGGSVKVASFSAGLTLDRREFGVGVGSWAETAVVGSDVEVEILVEANIK